MASTGKSARHYLQDILVICTADEQQGHSTSGPFSAEFWARMSSTTKSPRHMFERCLWRLVERGKLNKGALKHRRWGKDSFNKQVSNAFFAGCLLGICTKRKLNKGALKNRRCGKDGSTSKSPGHFLGVRWFPP